MARQNLFLFFLALVCAITIKFAVHEQEQLSERLVEAQVTYEQAAEGMISYDLQESVKVLVRGSSVDVARLAPFVVQVKARIPDGRPGAREVVLELDDVRFNVPGDFDALSLEPNRFSIQVEERVQKSVPIRILFTGEPSAGSLPGDPVLVPAMAEISGPKSKVEKLSKITAGVNLDGHARTFEEGVTLSSPETWVQVVRPAVVAVTIPMVESGPSIPTEGTTEDGEESSENEQEERN